MIEVEFTQSSKVWRGLDEIAAYLQVSRRAVHRWIHAHGFLAIRDPSDAYWTTTSLIDLWVLAIHKIELQARKAGAAMNIEHEEK